MSDLNRAIRDDLGQRARDVTPYAADHSMVAYANAIRSVLDLHTHSDGQHGLRICAACGLVSRGSWCDTVSAIADDLSVSSQDTPPAPRPEPRVWRHGVHSDVDPEVQQVIGGRSGGLYTRAPGKRFMWHGQKSSGVGIEYGVGSLLADEGHVTEVLSASVSTDTDGSKR